MSGDLTGAAEQPTSVAAAISVNMIFMTVMLHEVGQSP